MEHATVFGYGRHGQIVYSLTADGKVVVDGGPRGPNCTLDYGQFEDEAHLPAALAVPGDTGYERFTRALVRLRHDGWPLDGRPR